MFIESLNLVILFLLNIISIVILGVMISAFFTFKGNKKGILSFIFIFLVATIYFLIDFFNFGKIQTLYLANAIFGLLIVLFYIYVVIKLWKKLNKPLLFLLLIFSINFIFWTSLLIFYPSENNYLFHNISKLGMHLGTYFLIIEFLIKTFRGKK